MSRPRLKEEDRQYFQHFCNSPQLGRDLDVNCRKRHDQGRRADEASAPEGHVGPWWRRLEPPLGVAGHAGDQRSPAASGRLTPLVSLCGGPQSPAGAHRVRADAEQMQEAVLKDLLDAQRAAKSGADTPAALLLNMLSDMLLGRQPDMEDVALAKSLLLRHADPYQPLNLRRQMREANLDADVVHALMHQLGASAAVGDAGEQGSPRAGATAASKPCSGGGADGSSSSSSSGRDCPSVTECVWGRADAAADAAAAGPRDAGELAPAAASTDDDEDGHSHSLRDALTAIVRYQHPATAGSHGSEYGGGPAGGSGSVSSSDSDGSLRLPARRQCVPPAMLDEVERVLALADEWRYDTWRLAEVTQGHALSCLGFYLLHREGLISQFRMQPAKVARLLRTLEAGYPCNPYHNSTHAADVLQTLHVLLHGAGLTAHYLDRLGLLAAYFAAIVHDHGHPGLTADFLIATSDPLAVRYNDRSPLENHHGASFFALLQQPGLDALVQLSAAERATFRKHVLDLVMATDMKQHFALLAHFNTAHRLVPYNKDAGPWALARSGGAVGEERALGDEPRPADDTERVLSLQIALKAADLGHLGEELEVHKRWVRSLEEEFFRQGDSEQQLGLPISPLFDRAKQGVSKSQVGFYDFVALPLVHALSSAFPGAQPLMGCFVTNYNHWRQVDGQQPVEVPSVGSKAGGGGGRRGGPQLPRSSSGRSSGASAMVSPPPTTTALQHHHLESPSCDHGAGSSVPAASRPSLFKATSASSAEKEKPPVPLRAHGSLPPRLEVHEPPVIKLVLMQD